MNIECKRNKARQNVEIVPYILALYRLVKGKTTDIKLVNNDNIERKSNYTRY